MAAELGFPKHSGCAVTNVEEIGAFQKGAEILAKIRITPGMKTRGRQEAWMRENSKVWFRSRRLGSLQFGCPGIESEVSEESLSTLRE